MRVLICDRCGVVIEREDRTQCLTLTCTSGLNGMKMIHLCEDCREAFGEWMGENEEREGAAHERKHGPPAGRNGENARPSRRAGSRGISVPEAGG